MWTSHRDQAQGFVSLDCLEFLLGSGARLRPSAGGTNQHKPDVTASRRKPRSSIQKLTRKTSWEVGLKCSPGIMWKNRSYHECVWFLHGFLLSLLTWTVLILIQQKLKSVFWTATHKLITEGKSSKSGVVTSPVSLLQDVGIRFLTCESDLDWVLYCFYIVWFLCDLIHLHRGLTLAPKPFFLYYFQMNLTPLMNHVKDFSDRLWLSPLEWSFPTMRRSCLTRKNTS